MYLNDAPTFDYQIGIIMELYIIEDDLICNIQKDFGRQYPYLKLQFYKTNHAEGEASPRTEQLDAAQPVEEAAMFHTGGRIDISPERTVAEVEYDFFHQLGLCTQVLRHAGNMWITTTDTDHWTLKQQDDKGREHSIPLAKETPDDFNLQDKN